jgi:hypothetical protein
MLSGTDGQRAASRVSKCLGRSRAVFNYGPGWRGPLPTSIPRTGRNRDVKWDQYGTVEDAALVLEPSVIDLLVRCLS